MSKLRVTPTPMVGPGLRIEGAGDEDTANGALLRKRRGSIAGFASASYLTILFGLLTGPITARVLGPTGRGEVAAAVVYGGLAMLFLSWGLPQAVAYRVSTGQSKPGELLRPVMRWALYGAVPAVGAGAALGLALSNFSGPGRLAVAFVVALSPIFVVSLCVEAMLRGRGDLGTLTRARFIAIGLPAAGIVTLWLTRALSVGSTVAVTVLGSIATFAFLLLRLGDNPRGHVTLTSLLSFGSRSMLASAAIAISGRLDQAIIAPLLGSRDLGVYAVAVTVSSLPLGLASAVANRVWGEVGKASSGKGGAISALYVRRAVTAVLVATAPLAFISPFAIPILFGSKFQGSVAPTLLLLPGTLAGALVMAGETGLSALGFPGRASLAQIGGTVVGVLALAVLLRPFGIAGAAAATTLDLVATAAGISFFLRRAGAHRLLPGRSEVVELWQLGSSAVGSRLGILRYRPALHGEERKQ